MFNLHSLTVWFQQPDTICRPCIYLPVENQDTRFSLSSFSMMNCDFYLQLHYDTSDMRYEKGEHKHREKGGRRKCRLLSHEEESKVLLTIAFCGWCTLIILLLPGLPVHARVVSQYSFSFPVRNRQCLDHAC